MKTIPLFGVFVLCSLFSFAQLSVRNAGYVFVSNQVVFVEDAINLNESDSKIYLRNEGQLIQGSGTTGNSGIGALSVYQNGNTNQYAYNYWCSPVGNNSISNGNEAATVDLIDEATNVSTTFDPAGLTSSSDATFTSSYNGTSAPLQISRRWLYTFVTSNAYAEWNALDETTPIAAGLGFTMKGMGTLALGSQRYDFRGKANNGTIAAPISANQFTLIGNPYPSALDALLLIHDPQNANMDGPTTTGALYYWDQRPTSHFTSDYIGGYASYTITADGMMESFVPATFYAYDASGNAIPLPPPGETGGKTAKRYIPIGQGFMVEGTETTPSGSLIYIKNEHRVFEKESDGNSDFFRANRNYTTEFAEESTENTIEYNELGLSIVPEDYKRFRLNAIFNAQFTRQLLQNFHDSATDGFDYGMEAKLESSTNAEIAWITEGEPYAIQANAFDLELKIPVAITIASAQSIDFSLFDVQNFETSQPIYLHDLQSNVYTDLRVQDYSINLEAGDYPARFELTFQDNTLSTDEENPYPIELFQNQNRSQLTLLNPEHIDIAHLYIYNSSGKLVLEENSLGHRDSYHWSTANLSAGIYVATFSLMGHQAFSKKIIIKN